MREIEIQKPEIEDGMYQYHPVMVDGKPSGIRLTLEAIMDLRHGNAELESVFIDAFKEEGLNDEESAEAIRLAKVIEV